MAKKDKSLILLDNSIQRLTRNQAYFNRFKSLEHWIYTETNEAYVDKELEYLGNIKNIVLRNYWKQDIYVSQSALDDIIFIAIRDFDAADVLKAIDDMVENSHLKKNSVVIFPLHSFGFKYGGLGHLFGNRDFSYRYDNFQILPQSNSFDRTKKNIVKYLNDIKLFNRKKLDEGLFRHFYESRSLKWFERNPVMLMHFKFSQQERFDNTRFILEKINFVTNKLYFLSVLTNVEDAKGALFSTRNTNNWETLDIKHFLTVTSSGVRSTLNCIPVHHSSFLIGEKMHMNIDLLIRKKAISHWEKKAIDSIENLYKGYMIYKLDGNSSHAKYYRIAGSLDYFRRSVKSINKEDKIININIALESLLLDKHESNKKVKMLERLWAALKGKINKNENHKNIEDIISERNNIIHNGLPFTGDVAFNDVYKTYCRLILFLHDNISSIDSTKNNYLTLFYDSL